MTSGMITHIQRFSVHDGPGIRTTVFLKGCQLHCPWCHNPETYRRQAEIQFFPERCLGCRACAAVCRHAGHEFADGAHVYHRARCVACGACADTCYAQALVRVGEIRTAESVVAEVLADRPFYQPAGGVTISGGEPLAQAEFTRAILELCRRGGIHSALETNLVWPWHIVAPLVPLVDLFLVDIKLLDDAAHRAWTGLSNAQLLDNLRQLDALHKPLVVRTPVVVGVNERPEQIGAIAGFLATLRHVQQYELLPYHPLGNGKHRALGLENPPPEFHAPTAAELDLLAAAAARPQFRVRVAGATRSASNTRSSGADLDKVDVPWDHAAGPSPDLPPPA